MQKIRNVTIADTARVIGEVELGDNVSIWYGVSIRGDVAPITIGDNTNVQDNVVIHCDTDQPNIIGNNVSIGHCATVHGLSIGDGTLVGMGATILGGTRIGKNCLIAAGAVVPPGLDVPDNMMVMGVPGRIARETNEKEKAYLKWLSPRYIELSKLHVACPDDPRIKPFG
jgi:carbonic anhydrase/acetyltransferase-like protein (isoleucine patch superfamily)